MPSLPDRHPFTASLITGLGLVALGGLFALRNLGLLPSGEHIHFWPLALGFLALATFARRGILSWGGHTLLLAALALQLQDLGHHALLRHGWPVALIWVGCIMVARACFPPGRTALPATGEDPCGGTP